MKRITFSEFYQANKLKLSCDQLKELNPFDFYFESGGCFVGLDFMEKGVWVSIAIGSGIKCFREIRKQCQELGVKAIGFMTTPSNKAVNAIARYSGAELRFLDRKHPNGEQSLQYTVYLDHKRFRRI